MSQSLAGAFYQSDNACQGMIYCEAVPFVNAPDAHPVFRGRQSVHLMADTHEELMNYAADIGLRPRWLQKRGTPHEHFDVTGSRLRAVMDDKRVKKLSRERMVARITSRKLGKAV